MNQTQNNLPIVPSASLNMSPNTPTTSNNNKPISYSRILKPSFSKKQAILLPCLDNIALIEYVVGIGRLIGPTKILSASKISKQRVCIYLDSEIDIFMNNHKAIIINENRIEVRRLVSPSKRLIFSNVHTCIPNSLIRDALYSHQIKTTSSIHSLHIGLTAYNISPEEAAKYSHVMSFRRAVYIEDCDKNTIPDSLLITFENENYRIFVNNGDQQCNICHEQAHNSSSCPTIKDNSSTTFANSEHTDEISFQQKIEAARTKRDGKNISPINPLPPPPITPLPGAESLHTSTHQQNTDITNIVVHTSLNMDNEDTYSFTPNSTNVENGTQDPNHPPPNSKRIPKNQTLVLHVQTRRPINSAKQVIPSTSIRHLMSSTRKKTLLALTYHLKKKMRNLITPLSAYKTNLLYPNFSKTTLSLAPPKTISSDSFKKSCTHRSVLWLTSKCPVTPLTFLNSSRPSRSLN